MEHADRLVAVGIEAAAHARRHQFAEAQRVAAVGRRLAGLGIVDHPVHAVGSAVTAPGQRHRVVLDRHGLAAGLVQRQRGAFQAGCAMAGAGRAQVIGPGQAVEFIRGITDGDFFKTATSQCFEFRAQGILLIAVTGSGHEDPGTLCMQRTHLVEQGAQAVIVTARAVIDIDKHRLGLVLAHCTQQARRITVAGRPLLAGGGQRGIVDQQHADIVAAAVTIRNAGDGSIGPRLLARHEVFTHRPFHHHCQQQPHCQRKQALAHAPLERLSIC